MRYQFEELVDVHEMRRLLEAVYTLTRIPSAICDREGVVLVAVGWQDICQKFHRRHAVTAALCTQSDQYLNAHLDSAGDYVCYQCRNGMVDAAAPIVVAGEHAATLYQGQVFLDQPPDEEWFGRQAEQYGFPREEYLEALRRVPVIAQEELDRVMGLGVELAQVIAELSLRSLRAKEKNRRLKEVNRELRQTTAVMKNIQKHLIRSEKMAALGGLVAGVAHEINTPVGVSITAVSHLQQITDEFAALCAMGSVRRGEVDQYLSDLQESAAMVRSNLDRAVRLIRNFKQFSVDQSQEVKRTFNVRKCLDDIVLSLQPHLRQNRHVLHVECDENIDLFGRADELGQIVTNLAMNSVMHGYGEGEAGKLRIRVNRSGDFLRLVYSDNGRGMTEEVRQRIFEPFFTTRSGCGGSGLGMYILWNLVVDEFGGTVECSSEPGGGCTFTIELAVKEPAD